MWAVYAATIDQRDLHFYDLYHTGAQVLAEQHRFWYREDVKPHGVGIDRFDFEGKVYPNKQPGSIMAGALAYALLRPLGADYLHSYFLTGVPREGEHVVHRACTQDPWRTRKATTGIARSMLAATMSCGVERVPGGSGTGGL